MIRGSLADLLTQLTEPSALFSPIYFLGLWLLLWLPIAYPMALWLNWRPFQPSDANQKLPLLATLYGLAPLVLLAINLWIQQTFADAGMVFGWPLLMSGLIGLLSGSLSLLALFWLQARLGWQTLSRPAFSRSTLLTLLLLLGLALWVGWTEELVFRGFLQTQLQQVWPVGWTAVLISLLFALLHGIWEGKSVIPQLPGLWLMGMVLVLSRTVDQGRLGLAWGLHAGWVWAIASLDTLNLLQTTARVPAWLTGWDQKPLAGVVGIGFLLATAIALLGCIALRA